MRAALKFLNNEMTKKCGKQILVPTKYREKYIWERAEFS